MVSDTRGLEFRAPQSGGAGLDGLVRGYDDGDSDDETDLRSPLPGMNPFDLADWVAAFSTYSQGRILGVGASQYDMAGSQKFEHVELSEICDEFIEELADVGNYAAMLAARITWIRDEAHHWVRRPF